MLSSSMTPLQRVEWRIRFKNIPEYLVVFSVLGITAWIYNKYLESIVFAICFCFLRHKFTNILHYDTTLKCMLFTNGLIIASIPIIIPITNSLFGGLISSVLINYLANLIASNIFRKKEKEEFDIFRKEKEEKSIYSMNETEIREYCKLFGFDEIDKEIVVQRMLYHLKGEELYNKIGYSKSQMMRREKKIEAKLNIKLK